MWEHHPFASQTKQARTQDIQPPQEPKDSKSVCQCAGKVRYLYFGIQKSSTLASSTPGPSEQLLLRIKVRSCGPNAIAVCSMHFLYILPCCDVQISGFTSLVGELVVM
jgi:hypothetical protein